MRLTKFGHACVRLEHDGHVVVVDPGSFTQPEAVDGADLVLITHEHADHFHPDHLRAADAPVRTIEAVSRQIAEQAPDLVERVEVIEVARPFELGAFTITPLGERHAVIHPDLPAFDNSGYLIEVDGTRIFHPGDALTIPQESVDLLCLPISAPWLKVSEAVDFARAVGAPRHLGIHDRIYTDVAQGMFRTHFARLLGEDVAFDLPADGQDLAPLTP